MASAWIVQYLPRLAFEQILAAQTHQVLRRISNIIKGLNSRSSGWGGICLLWFICLHVHFQTKILYIFHCLDNYIGYLVDFISDGDNVLHFVASQS